MGWRFTREFRNWEEIASAGELGAALRGLGFERRRDWRGEDGFRTLWYPD